MKRKTLILLFIIALSFFITSCDSEGNFKFSSEMLINNISIEKEKIDLNKITINDLKDYQITNSSNGLLVVRDKDNAVSCWSLFKNELLFPFQKNITIELVSSVTMTYVRRTTNDGKSSYYDSYGYLVLAPAVYLSFNPSIVNNNDQNVDTEDYVIEKINYSYIENGITSYDYKQYKHNMATRTREDITLASKEVSSIENQKVDLSIYGLNKYYMEIINDTYYVYNSKDKLINTIFLPNVYSIGGFSGKLLYQRLLPVDSKSEEYTYKVSTSKYILTTFTVDLITGKEKELEVNYRINSIEPCKDKNNKVNFAIATISKIDTKKLSNDNTKVLIDVNGKILTEIGYLNIKQLKMIDRNNFYNPQNKIVYNEKLEPIYQMKSTAVIDNIENVIIMNDFNTGYGVIKGDGKILIPFDYQYIFPRFVNKKTYASDLNGQKYILKLDGERVLLDQSAYAFNPDLIFTYKYNESLRYYEGKFINNENVIKATIDFSVPSMPNFSKINNVYGTYSYCSFKTPGSSITKYVFVDITTVNKE